MLKRKKQNNSASEIPTPVAMPNKGWGLGRFGGMLIVLSALVLVVCAGAIAFLQNQERGASQQETVEGVSHLLAAKVADSVAFHADVLHALVNQARVISMLRLEDMDAISQQELALQRVLPGVLRIRLLPLEWDQLNRGNGPDLSFAALDLLKKVRKSGKRSAAEIHQFGSPQQHIALAMPVGSAGGQIVGVAHLSLSFDTLAQSVALAGALPGSIEIQQMAGATPLTLVSSGNAGNVAADGMVPIPGTIWQVSYWRGSVDSLSSLISVAVVLAGLGVIITVILVLVMRLKRELRADQSTIVGLVESVIQRRVGRAPIARISDLQPVLDRIGQLRTTVRGDISAKPAVAAGGEGDGKAPAAKPEKVEKIDLGDDFLPETPLDEMPMAMASAIHIPDSVFRAYDIRGIAFEELSEELVFEIGRAIGSEAFDKGQQTVIVARDGRQSGEALSDALCRGLLASGRDVVDLGMAPTPVLYFATHFLGSNSGVMVTGSHNPPEYNGLKIVVGGETLSGAGLIKLRKRIESGDMLQGNGSRQEQDLLPDYLARVTQDVQLPRGLKVVVDCGNGVAGLVAPQLLGALGCEVIDLYSEVDGSFPNHHPDPSKPENMQAVVAAVREYGADIGIAFDGDGDRLGVVDSDGKIIWPDRVLMLLARDVLSRQPGADIIYDVKSTRYLAAEILSYGGRPVMWKTGHSLIKAKMKESGALLAGEMSGHIFFKERWYGFDDALYSCARLLEVLAADFSTTAEVFGALPESISTPELDMHVEPEQRDQLMQLLNSDGMFPDAKLITIDGVRVEYGDGWGLARPSNTMPSIVFRFEADSAESLDRIQNTFRQRILQADSSLPVPF
jgi:phosphomannomutase/phosphoglucomutase